MSWLEPIVDRTWADVEYADANRGSLAPLKGMRNYSDLNRISGNLRAIRELLVDVGYIIPPITSRDDWDMFELPRESDIRKIKDDLITLTEAAPFFDDMPDVPELPYLHYQKLNDIESILYRYYTYCLKLKVLPRWTGIGFASVPQTITTIGVN